MNNKTLDQKRCIDSNKIINTTIKLQRKNQISNPKDTALSFKMSWLDFPKPYFIGESQCKEIQLTADVKG